MFNNMQKFEKEGKGVFMNDWDERYHRLTTTKYATIDQDWLPQHLKTKDCNFHFLAKGLRPVNVGFGFQKNSAFMEPFSKA